MRIFFFLSDIRDEIYILIKVFLIVAIFFKLTGYSIKVLFLLDKVLETFAFVYGFFLQDMSEQRRKLEK
jgi:hypothetical protein